MVSPPSRGRVHVIWNNNACKLPPGVPWMQDLACPGSSTSVSLFALRLVTLSNRHVQRLCPFVLWSFVCLLAYSVISVVNLPNGCNQPGVPVGQFAGIVRPAISSRHSSSSSKSAPSPISSWHSVISSQTPRRCRLQGFPKKL